jgi:hypothetical protein
MRRQSARRLIVGLLGLYIVDHIMWGGPAPSIESYNPECWVSVHLEFERNDDPIVGTLE